MIQLLENGAKALNVKLPPQSLAVFGSYFENLSEKSKIMNLTTITEPEQVATLHFLDSIAALNYIPHNAKQLIDVGCGAGFPGMVLKIAKPQLNVTLLDATSKKVSFIKELAKNLNLDITALHARAEELSQKHEMRENYDVATSRAVADLRVLSELCLPFVRVGGIMLAMKSISSDEEIQLSKNAITALGGQVESINDYLIPETDVHHRVVIIKKIKPTPVQYPRRYSKIQSAPL